MKFPIIISERQKENPVIQLLKGIAMEWTKDLAIDFSIGHDIAVLFLSLKFHRKNPNYIINRFKEFEGPFKTRVLLLLVDVPDSPDQNIAELTKLSIGNHTTVLLAFKYDEVSKWLISMYNGQETPLDDLKGQGETPYETATNCLHSLGLSKKEAEEMIQSFGSLEACFNASKEEILQKTSLSNNKVDLFYESLRSPF